MEATATRSSSPVQGQPAPAAAPAQALPQPEAAARPGHRPLNWSFLIRAGLVGGIVLFFVGFALYETYVLLWQGGVVNKGDYYEVDLRSMGNFEMDQEAATLADIPGHYRKLDGKKVLLQGEIAPADYSAGRGADFLLCYSVAKCCFGGPPKVQHFVACKVPRDGRQLPAWIGNGQIQVFGTLHVKIQRTAGAITSIYQLEIEQIRPVS